MTRDYTKGYTKGTGWESELDIMARIAKYLDDDHTVKPHKRDTDNYDFEIVDINTNEPVVDIEYELTTQESSDWTKGDCWFANKRGYNQRLLKRFGKCRFGIHVPKRKDDTWRSRPNSYWMKENIAKTAGHCIYGQAILDQPVTFYPARGWSRDKNRFRYMYGDELGDDGVYDATLLEMLQFIERHSGARFLPS